MQEITDKNGYVWKQNDKGLWEFKHSPKLSKSNTRGNVPLEEKYTELPPYKAIYAIEATYQDAFDKVISDSFKQIAKILTNSLK